MSKPGDRKATQVEIIAWAIPRIASGHYAVLDDKRGRKLYVTEFEPTLEEMVAELSNGSDERDESVRDALILLKRDCNISNIRVLFNLIHGEKLGEMLAKQFACIDLTPAHYAIAVAVVYKQLHISINSIQRILAKEREVVSVQWLANLENAANPEAISVGIVRHYAKEISNLFPKLIRRAERLRIIPTHEKTPSELRVYIEEASKCYIYGRFIACLIVCRSAIEFALRDRLIASGQKQALDAMRSDRNDSLRDLIVFARKVFPRKLMPTLHDADEVRKAANEAVHKDEPKTELCKDMFVKTRGVLGELYSLESSA